VDEVTEDVDVRDLDQGHVIPNMGVVVWRGVWYPSGYTEWVPAREIERRIDLTNIDLDDIATAVDARRPAWAEAGISVRPVTWVDHDAEWPAPLSTDRASITAPRSIGFFLDGPGSAETEFVVYAAGWADTDFVTELDGPVSSGYVELYTADEFVAVMDRIVAQVRRAVAGS
ncbi:MAG: hypothetical protein JWM86_622, partial [Thermoleophilia bacterium]|nr:hypothetical protein [Thermoleophilia bacterium]